MSIDDNTIIQKYIVVTAFGRRMAFSMSLNEKRVNVINK